MDEAAIRAFLQGRPRLIVAPARPGPLATELVERLGQRGLEVSLATQDELAQKAFYPRVWPPLLTVHRPTGVSASTPRTVETSADGRQQIRDRQGRRARLWPHQHATVIGAGLAVPEQNLFAEPGCQVRCHQGRWHILNGQPTLQATSDDVKGRWSRPWQRLSSYLGDQFLVPQLPEAYQVDSHLVLLGDGPLSLALEASELLPRALSPDYPGPGRALIMFAWSPFALERNVIYLAAGDRSGQRRAASHLETL
jgi:hypothetical protein